VDAGQGRAEPDLVINLGAHTLIVKVARDARAESLEAAISQLHRLASTDIPLIVVPYMTDAGAARCKAAGVAWADLSGNAHIEARSPGGNLWVHVLGQPNAFETRGRPRNAFAPKSARLARFLLAAPGGSWTQKELAQKAGLDPGHVSRLVGRLAKADLVVRDSDGLVAVPDPLRLLDAWAEGNAYRHDIIEGHLPGRSGEERAHRLADVVGQEGDDYAFTGLAAAWAYTGMAGFRSVACYVAAPTFASLHAAGFREDSESPNTRLLIPDDVGVLDGARLVKGLRCVAPFQAYVDLAHELERAEEFADALRSAVLATPSP
jgi:hypothetical protein